MTHQDKLKIARRAQRHLKIAAAANVNTLRTGDRAEKDSLIQRRDHHAKKANALVAKIGGLHP